MLSRNQYLKAMGIDVWVRREHQPSQQPPPVQPTQPAPLAEETAAKPAIAAPDSRSGAVPNFRLGLYHYETVGLCLLLNDGADTPRRLCDDIARVMGGHVDGVGYQELCWPMLDTAGIDQTIGAAREVVTQKFSALPRRVLVFGRDVAEYFQPLAGVTPMQPTRVGNQEMLLVSDLQTFMSSAQDKRQLLRILHAWSDVS